MSILNRKAKKPAVAKTEKSVASAKTTTKAKVVASAVLLRPVVTEKQTLNGTYAFEVSSGATKPEIAKAVAALFGVTPVTVRIINVIGKTLRAKNGEGHRKDWKKAIVRLEKGKTINVYEGM